MVGCFFAIVIVKQLFGGIGNNFANPAIAARIFLLLSFSQPMTTWLQVEGGRAVQGVYGATPLALISAGDTANLPSVMEMLLGTRGGCMGETCAIALILGGVYMIWKKVITPTIPLAFIGGVFVLSLLFGVNPVYELLGGGLMLGAFFMATDYTTSPITEKGENHLWSGLCANHHGHPCVRLLPGRRFLLHPSDEHHHSSHQQNGSQ